MADMKSIREEIDSIDRDLVQLLDRRARLAHEVGRAKVAEGRQTFDPGRQRAVIERALTYGTGDFPKAGLETVLREVQSVCLNLQKPLRVAYLGPPATFSHQAAQREFGSSVDYEPYPRITDIFAGVSQGHADYGIVPVENSTGGMVHETLDAFVDFELQICHEVLLPIHHALLGAGALADVKQVFSHPQALAQCAQWLRTHLPGVEAVEVASTIMGVQRAQETVGGAAIASEFAAQAYQLHVLARNIEDTQDNTTRFLVIANKDTPPCGADKTSLMFSIKDRPGVLFHLLKPFAERNINLSKIESRPTKRKAWEYVFFVDVHGHRTDANIAEAVKELEPHCYWLRVLGSYPRENR